MARETKRLHKIASKSIKKSEVKDKEAKLQRLQKTMQEARRRWAQEMHERQGRPSKSGPNVQRNKLVES